MRTYREIPAGIIIKSDQLYAFLRHATVCSLVLLLTCTLKAQNARLTLYGTHVIDIGLDYKVPTGEINQKVMNHNYQVGGGIEWQIKKEFNMEVLYLRQAMLSTTNARTTVTPDANRDLYFMLVSAGAYFINSHGKLNALAGIIIGTSQMRSQTTENVKTKSLMKPVCGARIAGNYWFSKSVGLKLETMFLLSQNVTYSSNFTRGLNSFTASSVYQLTVGSGLVIKI